MSLYWIFQTYPGDHYLPHLPKTYVVALHCMTIMFVDFDILSVVPRTIHIYGYTNLSSLYSRHSLFNPSQKLGL